MGLFDRSKKNGGFMDQIRCDEPSYLIWKWHPAGAQPNSNRENAIRWGSSLRVKDGEVAIFVYKQKNGIVQDFIEGPYDQIIKTANFPYLRALSALLTKVERRSKRKFTSSIWRRLSKQNSLCRSLMCMIHASLISVFLLRSEAQSTSASAITGHSSSCIEWIISV